jgi:hypothetical protein
MLTVVTIALAFATAGGAQTSAKRMGRVVGVYDDRTGSPLDSVEVSDLTTKSFALTTSTGTLSLFFVDSVGGILRFRKLGYKPLTMFVDNAEDLAPLTITLEPLAQELPKVVTVDSGRVYASPALRGFEERRRSGHGGRFVPETVFRKEEDRSLGNIVKLHIPGLDVLQNVRVGSRYADIAVTTRSGKQCPVDIYLDGLPVSVNSTAVGGSAIPGVVGARGPSSISPTNDLKDFLPKNLAAAEFYSAATAPAQFNRTGSGCGVLLLWSRER